MNKAIVGIFFLLMVISPILSITAEHDFQIDQEQTTNKTTHIKEIHRTFHCIPIEYEEVKREKNSEFITTKSETKNPFQGPGNQITPILFQSDSGFICVAYYDEPIENITFIISDDNGKTWSNPFPNTNRYTYPCAAIWQENRVFSTAVTHPSIYEGGSILINDHKNLTKPDTWSFNEYNFNDWGWYGMKDASIACDTNGNWWEWGVSCYVMSTTFGNGYHDGPTLCWAHPDLENVTWIGWVEGISGCLHCDIDIDPITHQCSAIFDFFNTTAQQWDLVLSITDARDREESDVFHGYQISTSGHLQCPDISVYDKNLIFLSEYCQDGDKDIICFHSSQNIFNSGFQTGFVVNSSDDECCPHIQHIKNQTFIASFIKNGDIYTTWTMDGGVTWTPPFKVNENQGLVTSTYKSSNLWYPFVIWEEQHQDIDIYFEMVSMPPEIPTIHGHTKVTIGQPSEFTITSKQSEGLNVSYVIDWGDGSNQTWTDPAPSGEPVIVTHIYDSNQSFQIRVKARNEQGVEGHWAQHEISVPRVKEFIRPFYGSLDVPSSKWLIGADQMQINDSGYGAPHERSREFAQEFIPTKPTLTAVALYFIRVGHPHEETTITVSIRDDLDGPDLTVIPLLAWDYRIKDFPPYTWVLFDFPDISVTPGHTYYIHETVSHQEYFTNSYGWGFGINNPYSKGNSWGKDLDIFDWKTLWEANGFDPKIPDPDFNFITYHQEPKAKTSHHPFLIFLEQHPHLFPFLRSLIGL